MENGELSCFKAYDIRGRVPEELNEDLAYRIGRAFVSAVESGVVVVGYDARLESPVIADALANGLTDGGVDVLDIGLCGTEEVYFQTYSQQAAGGVMVTASHNPAGYCGMKLVRHESRPISGDSGLRSVHDRVISGEFSTAGKIGKRIPSRNKSSYIKHLLTYVDSAALRPIRILADPGNGPAGTIVKLLADHLPFEIDYIREEPDGTFPHGVPNPLLPENREFTSRAVTEHGADLGIAWDGDFDRCFLIDADGRFIEGYYLVGLLAKVMLAKHPEGHIIHDPRLTWNTIEEVCAAGGTPVLCKTGHAFIKECMRTENAVYGGEMSSHHYFRDFAYCDSGMIPWLLVTDLMSRTGSSLADLVNERIEAYPCSGEINYRVDNAADILKRVADHFAPQAPAIDRTDGLSLEFADWRLNIRASNTEPLLRLNIETRGNAKAIDRLVREIERLF